MQRYKIHYIGTNYYTQTNFVREAERIGIQRAVSFGTLKHLKFGERILLANFIPNPNATKAERQKKIGTAAVFGYMTITGISHTLPPEYSAQLLEKLDTITNINQSKNVLRACGNYTIGTTTTITSTLAEVLEKLEETLTKMVHDNKLTSKNGDCNCKKCKDNHTIKCIDCTNGVFPLEEDKEECAKCNTDLCVNDKHQCCTKRIWLLDPNKVKWFIVGTYTPLSVDLTINKVQFTRGIGKVETLLKIPKSKLIPITITWLSKYQKRKYMPNYLKNDFGAKPNPQFNKYFGAHDNEKTP